LHVAFGVLLDCHWGGVGVIEEIVEGFVVEFEVGNLYFDDMLVTGVDLLEERGDGSRGNSSVFIIGVRSGHGKGFACSCLAVAEDAA
jgi:hypothetical protein